MLFRVLQKLVDLFELEEIPVVIAMRGPPSAEGNLTAVEEGCFCPSPCDGAAAITIYRRQLERATVVLDRDPILAESDLDLSGVSVPECILRNFQQQVRKRPPEKTYHIRGRNYVRAA